MKRFTSEKFVLNDFKLRATKSATFENCYECSKVTYESGSNKTQVDYVLMRKEKKTMINNVKAIASEVCNAQHKGIVVVERGGWEDLEAKRKLCKVWKKTKKEEDRILYCSDKAKKAVYLAQSEEQKVFCEMLDYSEKKENRVIKQIIRKNRGVVGVSCVKESDGKLLTAKDNVKERKERKGWSIRSVSGDAKSFRECRCPGKRCIDGGEQKKIRKEIEIDCEGKVECVEEFCYLRDMIGSAGGAES
ncbi:hypothetical protein HELRODRAFT_165008 [Helobdella robusta]|uniref:Uncharacterized protein n=1 Tax=Helobdella robusta TaxID=6412 RepID=T1EW43_HELRO|nr:hypothetical protein HELRODRAFT_165008 [Helobdella robusta]ESN92875.1 hypothetical protein HELRODRAFT_165008 [Helobdella robusta]